MPDTVKFLHTADLHLGAELSYLGKNAALRRSEMLLCFEGLLELGKKENIDLFLIAGDFFDNNAVTQDIFTSIIQKISQYDFKVIYVAGNHDPLSSDSPFITAAALPDNLIVLGTTDEYRVISDKQVAVYGKSFGSVYMNGKDNFGIAAKNDTVNIMLMHGDTTAGSEYNYISQTFLQSCDMDYVALGHIHKYSSILKAGKTYYAYSGCPEPHGFDELGPKGVIIAEVGKGICNAKFVSTAKRMHLLEEIDISNATDNSGVANIILGALKEKYGENFGDNLYKIILTGTRQADFTPNIAEIRARIANFVFFCKLRDKSEHDFDLEILSKENSLKGKFVKLMLEKTENANEDKKEHFKNALTLGLKAFSGEVNWVED